MVRSLKKKPSKPDWMFQRISYYLNDKHIAILRSAIPDTHTHSHIHTHAFISLVLLFFLYSIYPICNNLICFLVYDVFSLPYSKTNKSRDLIWLVFSTPSAQHSFWIYMSFFELMHETMWSARVWLHNCAFCKCLLVSFSFLNHLCINCWWLKSTNG